MTEERANKIYDVLVSMAGAYEPNRLDFVFRHTKEECKEWRFGGKFGFGGKYRRLKNQIDCYDEDMTPALKLLMDEINIQLKNI